MRVYVFERASERHRAFIASEHRLDLTVADEDREGIAERMGSFLDRVLTREQLLSTPGGRRALLDWESREDAWFDRLNEERAERFQRAQEARRREWATLTRGQRVERLASAKELLDLSDDAIAVLAAEAGIPRLRLV